MDIASSSIVKFNSADSSEYYEYIVIADDSLETVNVANIPNYIPYYITIIFGIGILCGLIFGVISAWKH